MTYDQVVATYKINYRDYLLRYKSVDGTTHEGRFFINNGVVALYVRDKRKYGYPVDFHDRNADFEVIPKKKVDPKKQWENSWLRVAKMLDDSELWDNILHDVRMGLEIGYENLQKISRIDKQYDHSLSYDENKKKNSQEMEAVSKLIELAQDKSFVVWNMAHPARVKKMNFGKFRTEQITNDLAQALKLNAKYQASEQGSNWSGQSYDTRIEFNPDLKKAWYSEEYRGCGNGHYYLALNATHAIYYEKD